jgi:hypothetical protein
VVSTQLVVSEEEALGTDLGEAAAEVDIPVVMEGESLAVADHSTQA